MLNQALKLIRQFHQLTQAELAKEIGLSAAHISEIEAGKNNITLGTLKKYATYFDVPLSHLILFAETLENEGENIEKVRKFLTMNLLRILKWIHGREIMYKLLDYKNLESFKETLSNVFGTNVNRLTLINNTTVITDDVTDFKVLFKYGFYSSFQPTRTLGVFIAQKLNKENQGVICFGSFDDKYKEFNSMVQLTIEDLEHSLSFFKYLNKRID